MSCTILLHGFSKAEASYQGLLQHMKFGQTSWRWFSCYHATHLYNSGHIIAMSQFKDLSSKSCSWPIASQWRYHCDHFVGSFKCGRQIPCHVESNKWIPRFITENNFFYLNEHNGQSTTVTEEHLFTVNVSIEMANPKFLALSLHAHKLTAVCHGCSLTGAVCHDAAGEKKNRKCSTDPTVSFYRSLGSAFAVLAFVGLWVLWSLKDAASEYKHTLWQVVVCLIFTSSYSMNIIIIFCIIKQYHERESLIMADLFIISALHQLWRSYTG